MQKLSFSSLCISEIIENSRPSTHRRRLFFRSALGMIGMQASTGISIPFRQSSRQVVFFSRAIRRQATFYVQRKRTYSQTARLGLHPFRAFCGVGGIPPPLTKQPFRPLFSGHCHLSCAPSIPRFLRNGWDTTTLNRRVFLTGVPCPRKHNKTSSTCHLERSKAESKDLRLLFRPRSGHKCIMSGLAVIHPEQRATWSILCGRRELPLLQWVYL